MNKNRAQLLELIHEICEQFENLLKHQQEVNIADWLQLVDEQDQPELFFELFRLETYHRSSPQPNNKIGEYFRKYPDFSNEVVKVFASNRIAQTEQISSTANGLSVETVTEGQSVGRYRIISPLGTGGFSTVYLANDPKNEQAVAIKMLRPEEGADVNRNAECIVNEASVLSQIEHPAIPKVYDVGKDEVGNPWVAMEFIKGESLYQMLATNRLSLVEVLNLLVKTAEAVHEIHRCGFAHRDIKPDNIIIGLDGEPRILDYGLALHEDRQNDKSGERAGTTAFMSPEQVRGHTEKLDGRTDIWSLGVILYLVVAKRLPFQGETKHDIRAAILGRPVRPPRQIKNNVATIELESICFHALRKNPEDRFSTAIDFADALRLAIEVLPERILLEEASRNRALTKGEQSSIQLARQAKVWDAQPVSSKLPGVLRYWRFRSRTSKDRWTETETRMMASAKRKFHRLGFLLCLLVLAYAGSMLLFARYQKEVALREMIAEIKRTPINEVDATFQKLSAFSPRDSIRAIEEAYQAIAPNDILLDEQIRYAMILSRSRPEVRSVLVDRLLNSSPDEIETLRQVTIDTDPSSKELDDQRKQQLAKLVTASPAVAGIEALWTKPPEIYADKLAQCGGSLKSRFAWCSEMTIDQFETLSSEMREFCYRPVSVRPWINQQDQQVVAAIWHRDCSDWKVTFGLTPAEFMATRSSESMHLVDVCDGLKPGKNGPLLVAVWSTYDDPNAEARHRLLAQRIPAVVASEWRRDSNFGFIKNDIDSEYLHRSPLLLDVRTEQHQGFEASESRERQKIAVGKLIARYCLPDKNGNKLPEEVAQHLAGLKLQADAHAKLGNYASAVKHKRPVTDSDTWEQLLERTRQFARANDARSAHHYYVLLCRAMQTAIENKTRPCITPGIAKAIDNAVKLELLYFETKDLNSFYVEVKRHMAKVNRLRSKRPYLLWAEYQSLAIVSNSVLRYVKNQGQNPEQLKQLTDHLVSESLRAKPSLQCRYRKELAFKNILTSPTVSPYLVDETTTVRTSAWSGFTHGCQSRFLEPKPSTDHQKACESLSEDFYPVSIVLGHDGNGNVTTGSVWHRQMNTEQFTKREQKVANAMCFGLRYEEDFGVWEILASENQSALKRRIIDTFRYFKIDVSVLVERLNSTDDPVEKVAILKILRNYSSAELAPHDVNRILDSLELLECEAGTESENLAKITSLNLKLN